MLVDSILKDEGTAGKVKTHELPYYAKWLLIAAYLASFNPPKMDALYFMKSTERKRRRREVGLRDRAVDG